MESNIFLQTFNDFYNLLKSNIQADQKYDLAFLLKLNYDQCSQADLEKISKVLKHLEFQNLFSLKTNLAKWQKIQIYHNFYQLIKLEYIDFTTFFSDLNYHHLQHLKQHLYHLFKTSKGSVLEQFYIERLKVENKKFRNDHDTVVEICNLKIPLKIKKKFILQSTRQVRIDENYFSSKQLRDFYINRFGKYDRNFKYRMTM